VYANAVDISAYGDVTVVNGGAILAFNNAALDVIALVSSSIDGSVSIDNQVSGSITAAAYDGFAIAVYADAYGAVDINNDGTILASSFNGTALGIVAYAYDGDASISNAGSIQAYSLNGETYGVLAVSNYGNTVIDNSGSIAAGGDGAAVGVTAISVNGNAYVTSSGSIDATSNLYEATGITATSKVRLCRRGQTPDRCRLPPTATRSASWLTRSTAAPSTIPVPSSPTAALAAPMASALSAISATVRSSIPAAFRPPPRAVMPLVSLRNQLRSGDGRQLG